MNKQYQVYLQSLAQQDTKTVNRIAVSVFLYSNNIYKIENSFLRQYLITEEEPEYHQIILFTQTTPINELDDLLEFFEYVVSPSDKIVTGAVYTPKYIRDFIVSQCLAKIKNFTSTSIYDPACGCGGFLLSAIEYIKQRDNKSVKTIVEQNLFGLDIADYSIERTKIILSILSLLNDEDNDIDFQNLQVGNALNFKWQDIRQSVKVLDGFDIVVGNPPYVCSRNIDVATKNMLVDWEVASSGHPDLYIPFFQIGLENLKPEGTLGFITVNTFFKSVNGRSLREYFSRNMYSFKIIDFRDKQLFKKRSTYTCLCFINKKQSNFIEYACNSNLSIELAPLKYHEHLYSSLDNLNGWNLVTNTHVAEIIKKLEQFNTKLFSSFSFSTGIATLKNNVYIFNPIATNRKFYWLKDINGESYQIEKEICREVVNSNRLKTEKDIEIQKRKIIFPYHWKVDECRYQCITEEEFQLDYPMAYQYLNFKKEILKKRDKEKKNYENWFAYGRNQGLNIQGFKLFLPHISKKPRLVLSREEALMFCNGEAIISNSDNELMVLKRILESEIFWFYIKHTSKPYSSGYVSFSKNYIKHFSLPLLNEKEKQFLIETLDEKKVIKMLLKKYDLDQMELKD